MKRANVVERLAFLLCAAVLATAGCSSASAPDGSAPPEESDDLQPSAWAELEVVTASGERWSGNTARIRIIAPLPDGRPAVAEVHMSAASPRGLLLGLHLEVDPSVLLDGKAWEIDLDGEKPTRRGLGVLSYGSRYAPRLARSGHLTATLEGGRLTASFEAPNDDEPSFSSAKVGARYVVECFVPETGPSPVRGSPTGPGAVALRLDSELESEFCAQFRGL
jgi:hypothetical protein